MEDHKKSTDRKDTHRKAVRKKTSSGVVNHAAAAEKDSDASERKRKRIREYAQAYRDFAKLLKKHHDELRKIYAEIGSDCFRIYDRELSVFPFAVEKYGRAIMISDDPADYPDDDSRINIDWERITDITSRMTYTEPEDVICLPVLSFPDLEAAQKLFSAKAAEEIEVKETGFSYSVYAGRGSFRSPLAETVFRNLILSEAAGKRLLSAGDRSGLHTLFAAAGGAAETTALVPSARTGAYAQRMLEKNHVSALVHRQFMDKEFITCNGAEIQAGAGAGAGAGENEGPDAIAFFPENEWRNETQLQTGNTAEWEKREFYHIVIFSADEAAQHEERFFRQVKRLYALVSENGLLLLRVQTRKAAELAAKAVTNIIQNDAASDAVDMTQELIPPGFTKKRFPLRIWMIRRKKISSRKNANAKKQHSGKFGGRKRSRNSRKS